MLAVSGISAEHLGAAGGLENGAFLSGKMHSSFAKIGKMVVINSILFLF